MTRRSHCSKQLTSWTPAGARAKPEPTRAECYPSTKRGKELNAEKNEEHRQHTESSQVPVYKRANPKSGMHAKLTPKLTQRRGRRHREKEATALIAGR